MIALIRRLHILAGLLVFSQFLIYGIAGVVAATQSSLERSKVPYRTEYVDFRRAEGESDKQVAARVFALLKPEMARPVPDWFLQKTPEGYLRLDFYNINGILRVGVEPERLRVEHIRNGLALFLEDVHGSTLNDAGAPMLVRVWATWNELGIWGLLFFCVSGVWLWLSTRPRWAWAWVALGGSCVVFGVFWAVFQ